MGSLNDNLAPLELDGGVVEVVEQFKYLGSLVHGGVVGVKLAVELFKHLGVFGSLHDSVFTASDLTMETKRIVYQSVVLGLECCCMVLKPGPSPRIWSVSWTGSTDAVFTAFWV